MRSGIIVFLAGSVFGSTAWAGGSLARYDFENTPTQINFSTLDLHDNGHDLTIEMMNQAPGLWVRNNAPWFPPEWGNRSLDITLRPYDEFSMTVQPGVSGIMFEYASTGPQVIDIYWEITFIGWQHSGVFTLDNRLFSGDQPALFSFSFLAPTDWFTGVRFRNISQHTGYMGIDNIVVIIPAPGSIGLLAFVGLSAARRRRSD